MKYIIFKLGNIKWFFNQIKFRIFLLYCIIIKYFIKRFHEGYEIIPMMLKKGDIIISDDIAIERKVL